MYFSPDSSGPLSSLRHHVAPSEAVGATIREPGSGEWGTLRLFSSRRLFQSASRPSLPSIAIANDLSTIPTLAPSRRQSSASPPEVFKDLAAEEKFQVLCM